MDSVLYKNLLYEINAEQNLRNQLQSVGMLIRIYILTLLFLELTQVYRKCILSTYIVDVHDHFLFPVDTELREFLYSIGR
jgi:hypothetical protein